LRGTRRDVGWVGECRVTLCGCGAVRCGAVRCGAVRCVGVVERHLASCGVGKRVHASQNPPMVCPMCACSPRCTRSCLPSSMERLASLAGTSPRASCGRTCARRSCTTSRSWSAREGFLASSWARATWTRTVRGVLLGSHRCARARHLLPNPLPLQHW
jgi:hypothetical protein